MIGTKMLGGQKRPLVVWNYDLIPCRGSGGSAPGHLSILTVDRALSILRFRSLFNTNEER
jgi:hypothetical protein